MMSSVYGVTLPGPTPIIYASDSIVHDEVLKSTQPSYAPRRLSRGSNGHGHTQRPSMSMRIVKPTSANNSPRSSILAARRRTVMNGGDLTRKRQQVLDQLAMPLGMADYFDNSTRAARPVSWHPSSHMAQPPVQVTQAASQHPFPAFNDTDLYQSYPHFSPTPGPATYSCNTSPSTAFSPLSLPFPSFEGYPSVEGWNLPIQATPSYVSDSKSFCEPFPALSAVSQPSSVVGSSSAAAEWQSFAMHGFSTTSPPTPETLPSAQQAQPAVPSEESITYQALEEPEEEGEILVGMGLYDTPAKYDSDPQLENYRSTTSQLLDSTFRPATAAAIGKGLKLEESWEPPVDSDDEEEDDDVNHKEDKEDNDETRPKQNPMSTTADNISTWI